MTTLLILIVVALLWFRPRLRAAMTGDEAARVLGITRDASADDVRAAHRRLIARLHPDTGGSPDLAARINAARDALLKTSI